MRAVCIYLIAFICGFTLMSFEILGSRILAPYFGQSIYVWGALISVLLTALGIGNYLGGIMADRRRDFIIPLSMTSLCAVFFLATPWLSTYICKFISYHIDDPRSGVLLAAAMIFWLPAVCLGTVIPSLVKLLINDLHRLGRGSGLLLGISTAGNIAGTLLTAFFFIGRLPTGLSIQLLAIPMVLCAVISVLWQVKNFKMINRKTIIIIFSLFMIGALSGCQSAYRVLRADPPEEISSFLPRHDLLRLQQETFPFRRFWEAKRINWAKYHYVYVAPVDTSHIFHKSTWDKLNSRDLTDEQFRGAQQINRDVRIIGQFMRQAFINALHKRSKALNITVVSAPTAGSLNIRLALVKLVPTKVYMNAGGMIASFFVPGAGIVAGMASPGSVGIEGMVFESSGKVIMMFAEQDKDTATLVDIAGLKWYTHSKHIITEWGNDFSRILKNPGYKKVRKKFPARFFSI